MFFGLKLKYKQYINSLNNIGESYGEMADGYSSRSDFSFRLRAGCERKRENNVPYQRRNENRMEQGKISSYCGEPELPRGEKPAGVSFSAGKSGGGLAKFHRNTAGSWRGGSYHCRNGRS